MFFGWVILIIQLADEVQCYQDSIALWMHGPAEEEVAMCLAWIRFHEDSGSNCAKSLLGASFNFSRRPWPFARTRECVDGGKEIEGNILETGGELARIGCCCWW